MSGFVDTCVGERHKYVQGVGGGVDSVRGVPMRRAALIICALPLGALLAGWVLEKEQCVMWGLGNDVNVFSWQLTS